MLLGKNKIYNLIFFMNISNCKSLIELYFNKSKEKKRDDFFLSWLKPNYNKPYTWGEISDKILTLSKK